MYDEFMTRLGDYTPLTALIGLVVYLFRNFINDFSVTNLEIKLKSPNAKFLRVLSRSFVSSILTIFIVSIFIIPDIKKSYADREIKTLEFNDYFIAISVTLFIFTMVLSFFTYYLIKTLEFIVGLNYNYKIKLSDDSEWGIIRINNKNVLVTENGEQIKFINSPFEHTYEKILISNEIKVKFYRNQNAIKFAYLVLCSLIIILAIVANCFRTNGIIISIILLVVTVLFMCLLIIFSTVVDYKKYQKRSHS